MNSAKLSNLVKAILFAFSLTFAPFTMQALAQNTTGTATQSNTGGGGSQATRETRTTTTTTQTSQPSETTTTINPVWIAVGAIALIALVAIVVMASRKRSGNPDKTVYESKTVVKKE